MSVNFQFQKIKDEHGAAKQERRFTEKRTSKAEFLDHLAGIKRSRTLSYESKFAVGARARSGEIYQFSMVPLIVPSEKLSSVKHKAQNLEHLEWPLGKKGGSAYHMLLLPLSEPVKNSDMAPFLQSIHQKFDLNEFAVNSVERLNHAFSFPAPGTVSVNKGKVSSPETFHTFAVKENPADFIINESKGNWATIYNAYGYTSLASAMKSNTKRFPSPITGRADSMHAAKTSNAEGGFMDWSAQSDIGGNRFSGIAFLLENEHRGNWREFAKQIADILNLEYDGEGVSPEEAERRRKEREAKTHQDNIAQRKKDVAERLANAQKAANIRKGTVKDPLMAMEYLSGRLGTFGSELTEMVARIPKILPRCMRVNPNAPFYDQEHKKYVNIPLLVTKLQRFNPKTGELDHTGDHYTGFKQLVGREAQKAAHEGLPLVVKTDKKNAKRRADAFWINEGAENDYNIELGSTSGSAAYLTSLERLRKEGEIHLTEGIENAAVLLYGKKVPVLACIDANGLINVELPPEVKRVTIHVDLDASATGLRAAMMASARFEKEGREVALRFPECYKDYPHIVDVRPAIEGLGWEQAVKVADELKDQGRNVHILARKFSGEGVEKISNKIMEEQPFAQMLTRFKESMEKLEQMEEAIAFNPNNADLTAKHEELLDKSVKMCDAISDSVQAFPFTNGEVAKFSNEANNLLDNLMKNASFKEIVEKLDISTPSLLTILDCEAHSHVAIPYEYKGRPDIVFTLEQQGVPYDHPALGLETKVDEGKVLPVNKGYDLADEINHVSIDEINMPFIAPLNKPNRTHSNEACPTT